MVIVANKFKNIIFDLGGVILNIDPFLTEKAFYGLGICKGEDYSCPSQLKELSDVFEKGEITSVDFRNEIKKHSRNSIDDTALDNAWNAMLLDLPVDRLVLLKRFKQSHRSFLLSNSNEIHIKAINKYLLKNFEIDDLTVFFEKMYFSYMVGMRKPDTKIFELVLSENNLNPGETLFIDDSIQNIEAAETLGIQTCWIDLKKETIMEVLH